MADEIKQQTNNESPSVAQPSARAGQGFRQIRRPGMGEESLDLAQANPDLVEDLDLAEQP
jgi:hypothetical protein